MKAEPRLDVPRVIDDLRALGVPLLLIGRQAVRLYGSDCFTRDFDFWLPPEAREVALTYFEERGFDLSSGPKERRPFVHVHGAPMQKLDLIFVRAIRTFEGTDVVLEDVRARARTQHDPETGLTVLIPDIDDLIALKKVRPGNPRDAEDVRFLLARKALESEGSV